MKVVGSLAVLLLVCLFLSSFGFGQTATINLSQMDPDVAKKVLEEMRKLEKVNTIPKSVPIVDSVDRWVDVGTKLGKAMAGAAKEMSVETGRFVDTSAGKVTVFIIAWKVIGHDLWKIIGGSLAWILITSVLLWSYSKFHMSKKIKLEENEVKFIPKYEFTTPVEEQVSRFFHFFTVLSSSKRKPVILIAG